MDLEKLNEEMDNLPDKKAILNIINEKTNSDMDRFISEIKSFKSEFETKLESQQNQLETKLESQQSKSYAQHKIMLWAISLIGVVLSIILTIVTFKI